jgi:hypothetical protein
MKPNTLFQVIIISLHILSLKAVKVNTTNNIQLTNKNCNPLCLECNAKNFNYCTICKPGAIFYEYTCSYRCPDGMFLDNYNTCQMCHPICPICWGPDVDMCGSTQGIKTKVISLEEEIIRYLANNEFTSLEIEQWKNKLSIVLKEGYNNDSTINFTNNQIYLNNNNIAIVTELPIGSFSQYNGIFIPIPSYLNKDDKFVDSHWVFKKGVWDGREWVGFYPRLPSYLKDKGDKDKIYTENEGFWLYDKAKSWYYVTSKNKIFETITNTIIDDKLINLNRIKFKTAKYNYTKKKEHLDKQKLSLEGKLEFLY